MQNVVTYTTVIAVSNPDRILMPGMTANVRIQVDRRDDAMRVPNAALRFRPPGDTSGLPGGSPGEAPAREGRGGAAAPAAQPAGGGGGGDGAGRGGAGSFGQMRETLTRELALTPEQQQRLDAILGESRQAFGAMRGQGLDEKAREAQRPADPRGGPGEDPRDPHPRAAEEVRGAGGNPGGRRRWRRHGAPSGMPARVFVAGPDGKPKAVAIFIGLTDGSYSEVLRGELQPGHEILIGQAGATPQRGGGGRGGGGPRMRF